MARGKKFTEWVTSKDMLKTGYRVKFRNGEIGIVFKDCETKNYGLADFCIINPHNYQLFIISTELKDDLTYAYDDESWDIMEVRSCYVNRTFLERDYEDLPIIWQRETNNYTMYRADFEIDNGARYEKHTALILAKNKEDAWDKFNELINPLLQYDESVYDPKIEEVKISPDSFVYIDLIKKDNETKEFINKKVMDNNYSFEVGV